MSVFQNPKHKNMNNALRHSTNDKIVYLLNHSHRVLEIC
jgi:hypothetical protein